MEKSCPKRGATLFELLIVVAILAVIAGITVSGLGRYQKNARDAKRKSDLKEVKTALELFRKDCGFYPTDKINISTTAKCGELEPPQPCPGKGLLPLYPDDVCIDVSTKTLLSAVNFLPVLVQMGYLKKELLDPINTCPNSCSAPDAAKDFMYVYYTWDYGKRYCLMTMLENKNDSALTKDDTCDDDSLIQTRLQPIYTQATNFTEGNLYAVSSN